MKKSRKKQHAHGGDKESSHLRRPAPKVKAFDFWQSDTPQSLVVADRVVRDGLLGRLDQDISDLEVGK